MSGENYDVSAYVQNFKDNLGNVPEQRQSRLIGCVDADLNYSEPGGYMNADDVEEADAPRDNPTKMAPITPKEIGQGRRMAAFVPMDDYFHVDNFDKVRLASDPTSKKMVAMTSKREKDKDKVILAAAFGTTLETDVSGNPSVLRPLPTAQVIAADSRLNLHDTEKAIVATSGSLGLTMGKLITAKMMLNKSEIEGEEDYFIYNSDMLGQLLASTAGSSSDYNQVKALIDGKIDTYLGFKFVRYEALTVSSSIIDAAAWRKPAVQYGERQLTLIDISQRKDLSGHPWQYYYKLERAGLRRYDNGVVKIQCHQVRQLAS